MLAKSSKSSSFNREVTILLKGRDWKFSFHDFTRIIGFLIFFEFQEVFLRMDDKSFFFII